MLALFGTRGLIALAMMLCLIARVAAQDLPSGITLIVPYAPGGIVDVTSRLYADALSRRLGLTIVVENRPAGGGAVAVMSVKNASPDGRTLLVHPGTTLAALPFLERLAYDPLKDCEPVAALFDLLNFIAVPPDSPANTIPQLLDLWKSKPGGLNVGSAGFGSPAHFNSVILSLDNALPITIGTISRIIPIDNGSDFVADRYGDDFLHRGAAVHSGAQDQDSRAGWCRPLERHARHADHDRERSAQEEGKRLVCCVGAGRHAEGDRGSLEQRIHHGFA